MQGNIRIIATLFPIHKEALVIFAASSGSLAPIDRATKAVVPAEIAMRIACRAKKILCPVVTDATAEAPSSPTILILAIPIIENRRLLRIAGQASSQILRDNLLESTDSSTSDVLELAI